MGDVGLLLLIGLVIVLLWRGPKALPRLGAAAGDALRNARRAADRSGRDDRDKEDTGPKA